MLDFHDAELVDWRCDVLGEIDEFCGNNILDIAPQKHDPKKWLIVLSCITAITIIFSFLLQSVWVWGSNMFGNIAAGLIASLILLLYTTNRDANIAYYENLIPSLNPILKRINIVDNKLHHIYYQCLYPNPYSNKEDFYTYILKLFLYIKSITDVYKQVKGNDRIEYQNFSMSVQSIEAFEIDLDHMKTNAALSCDDRGDISLAEIDKQFRKAWDVARQLTRELERYTSHLQHYNYKTKYGTHKKQ